MYKVNDYVKFHNGKRTVKGTVTIADTDTSDMVTIWEADGQAYKVNKYNVSEVKPELHNTKLVYESDDVCLGREERTGRTYVYEREEGREKHFGWQPGRYVEFDRSRSEWVSMNTGTPVYFTTHAEIAQYWRENMMLSPSPVKGSQQWIDSMMNSMLPPGQSLKHTGLYTMEDLNIANTLLRQGKHIIR
jgi:hypothetical protein